MDTNEMIALLLPPNGCFACSDTRKEIAEELARRSVDLERECADADKICAALGLTVDKSRTEGGSLNVPRIVGHIQETLTALRESHAFGVAMSDKYVASRAPECAAAQVAWQPIATAPEGRVVLVFYKNQLGNGRTMRARYYLPETLESEQTESGWADEGWYEESEAYEYLMPLEHEPTHWMPMPAAPDAAAPAQAEPQPVSVPYELLAHDKPQPAPTPNPGPIGSSLGVAAPDVAALVTELRAWNFPACGVPPEDLLHDAAAALQSQQDRLTALTAERDEARQLFNKEYNEANESRRRLRQELSHERDCHKRQTERAERAESALAACEAREKALRELLRRALHATSANMSMDMYAEVCRAIDSAALARKEGV